MTIDTRQIIGGSVDDLAEGLRPFIERVFAELLPGGLPWVQVLAHKDELAGRPTSHHHANDVGLMLRVMTEKLGNLGYPFEVTSHGRRRTGRVRCARCATSMRTRSNSAPPKPIGLSIRRSCSFAKSARPTKRSGSRRASRRCCRRWEVAPPAARFHHRPAPRSPRHRSRKLPVPPTVPLPSATIPASTDSDAADALPLTRRQRREQPETDASATPPAPTPSARLSLDAVTELSYAMAHARIVPVQEVRVSYSGPSFAEHRLRSKPLLPLVPWGRPRS